METHVACPDCGKYIAPQGSVDETMRCKCGEAKGPTVTPDDVPVRPSISVALPNDSGSVDMDDKDDTDALPGEPSTRSTTATKEKRCYICDADLTGKVRLKDHLGRYWCKQCASKDKKRQRQEEKGRCPDCSRVFPPEKLVYFQTTRVCPACFREREKELEKKIKKAAAEKIHDKAEWSSIKWMAIAAGVLLLLGTIGYFMHH